MKISIHEARQRLAKAGLELGRASSEEIRRKRRMRYEVTTPIGSKLYMQASEVIGLLRDLENPAAAL